VTRVFNKATETQKRRDLRNNMPQAEVLVWSRIRRQQLAGHRFRRQYSVGPYVIDFYCPALKLAVEIDGLSHLGPAAEAADRERQVFIESFGIRFVRFTNEEVLCDLDGVVEAIAQAACHPPYCPP